jgi:hypothetical protein
LKIPPRLTAPLSDAQHPQRAALEMLSLAKPASTGSFRSVRPSAKEERHHSQATLTVYSRRRKGASKVPGTFQVPGTGPTTWDRLSSLSEQTAD